MTLIRRAIATVTSDRTWWFLYAVPVAVSGLVLSSVLRGPTSDARPLAAIAMGCAVASLLTCWFWAFRLSRIAPSDAVYVKGTTSARMMLAFWGLLAVTAVVSELLGSDPAYMMPLLEGPLMGFVGIGSVLLTVGPAYKEYKEACAASAHEAVKTESQRPTKVGSSCRNFSSQAVPR